MNKPQGEKLRLLPKTDRILADADINVLKKIWPAKTIVSVVREEIEKQRIVLLQHDAEAGDKGNLYTRIKENVLQRFEEMEQHTLKRVVNATGVILHTNLGRAPLPERVLEKVTEVAGGYSNLEYDLKTGLRGRRTAYVESLLTVLTGAESALVVNNNAAALYLALNTLCAGKEALVSRGELAEIGDSFRILDIMEASGCIVREVGATNRTRLTDYEKGINPQTSVLLKVHTSNYTINGFAGAVESAELTPLRMRSENEGLVVVEDMGSGIMVDWQAWGLPQARTVADAVKDGVDVITFSGDKLLGGPQSGVLVGRSALITRMGRNPLYRCLRADKLCLAALEGALRLYCAQSYASFPVLRMLTAPIADIQAKADKLCALLAECGVRGEVRPHTALFGGGALPGETLESRAVFVRVEGKTAAAVEAGLRGLPLPVIVSVQNDEVALDLRTIDSKDLSYIAESLANRL